MRNDSLPRNAKLAKRYHEQLARERADACLRAAKRRKHNPLVEVEAGLARQNVGAISAWLVAAHDHPHELPKHVRSCAGPLLRAVAERSRLLREDAWEAMLPRLVRLAHYQQYWVRPIEDWRPTTYNVERQFTSLVHHLICKYPTPKWFDGVWTHEDGGLGSREMDRHRAWFAHVAHGANLRTARGLPIELTKAMAHHAMHAPDDASVEQAIRYGQARGLGVSERLTRAVLGSRIGTRFTSAEREAFWLTFLRWLALNPMLDPAQVGPIVDYLHDQRFVAQPPLRVDGTFVTRGPAQPNLSMHRRCPNALVAHVNAWHRQLGRGNRNDAKLVWPASGIVGYERIEGEAHNQRRYEIVELLSAAELRAEGSAMGHCVATYAYTCHVGRTAIFGLRVTDAEGWRQRLTVEVRLRERQIAQARGRRNAMPTPIDVRILNAWAQQANLSISPHAWF